MENEIWQISLCNSILVPSFRRIFVRTNLFLSTIILRNPLFSAESFYLVLYSPRISFSPWCHVSQSISHAVMNHVLLARYSFRLSLSVFSSLTLFSSLFSLLFPLISSCMSFSFSLVRSLTVSMSVRLSVCLSDSLFSLHLFTYSTYCHQNPFLSHAQTTPKSRKKLRPWFREEKKMDFRK